MDGQSQLAENFGRLFVQASLFQPLCSSPEPTSKSPILVEIAEFAQQPPDVIRALMRSAYDSQSRFKIRPPGFEALEQHAFEFAAILRPFRVNPAVRTSESGARLAEAEGRSVL